MVHFPQNADCPYFMELTAQIRMFYKGPLLVIRRRLCYNMVPPKKRQYLCSVFPMIGNKKKQTKKKYFINVSVNLGTPLTVF